MKMLIGLFSKDDYESYMVCTEIIDTLRKYGIKIQLNKTLYEKLSDMPSLLDSVIVTENPHKGADMVIIVGGDGSVLSFIREKKIYDEPILPVNTGKRGILSEVDGKNVATALEKIIEGKYHLEKLPVLKIMNIDAPPAVNEILILPVENIGKISYFRLKDEKENFICNVECDGIIIASSLGSTAYSLSAGGAVLHPQVDAYIITFINPLNRNFTSLVMPNDMKIIVELIKPTMADVFIDGKRICTVDKRIVTGKSKEKIVFVRLAKPPKSFYKRFRKRIA
ncbi:hypothetical protein DRO02_02675 [archaeon]|nr:MAG: hypothetical protein DRO02_02675 [archaeon]RLG65313.1 MAG: hypothetical protein DRO21_02210 [archaeon]